ncbi:hypothetical protein OUZ56_033658 [Daphnia magna]|uniref:Uncharacterized protein n=1 Tax=Daphnia magna TaxID=35525 RepID=A0ABQ9ZY45_9CRUS|nr:hypothetical protein OUZ56_033658 [Daphnia magna]
MEHCLTSIIIVGHQSTITENIFHKDFVAIYFPRIMPLPNGHDTVITEHILNKIEIVKTRTMARMTLSLSWKRGFDGNTVTTVDMDSVISNRSPSSEMYNPQQFVEIARATTMIR